jgi:hypothetical protein
VETTSPSCPGLGCIVINPTKKKIRTPIASAGVKLSAMTRGAVQFTDPEMDHCIGNLSSARKREFARTEIPIIIDANATAMISTLTQTSSPAGAEPKGGMHPEWEQQGDAPSNGASGPIVPGRKRVSKPSDLDALVASFF